MTVRQLHLKNSNCRYLIFISIIPIISYFSNLSCYLQLTSTLMLVISDGHKNVIKLSYHLRLISSESDYISLTHSSSLFIFFPLAYLILITYPLMNPCSCLICLLILTTSYQKSLIISLLIYLVF